MPYGTITSTENTFGTVNGALSGTVAGTLTGNVGVPGPQGPAGPGSTWGGIAGTLSNQTDLQNALNAKYDASNPSGFQTAGQVSTALAPYLLSSTAASTYQTQAAMSSYLTKADNLASVTSTSAARSNLGLGSLDTPTFAGITAQGSGANVANLTPTSLSLTHATSGSFTIQPSVGITFPNGSVQTTAFTTALLSGYATESWVTAGFYPLTGNPSGFLTSSALTGYATQSWVSAGFAPLARAVPSSGTTGQVLTKNSGTDYDASWATLVPGDRYLTTSSTSNTIGNGTKTFTVGTGLSYTTQQDIVIAYDANNHMHAVVTSYNSGTGVMVVDVKSHTGSGTYTSWTVNVGGTTPLQTVEWGEILGTLGDQTDLSTALNAKLESATAATTYAALAGATFTGEVITPASTTSNAGLTITPGTAPTTPTNGEIWATTSDLQVRLNGVTETIAEQSWVTSQGYITSSALTPYAPLAGATFTGLVGTVASTTTTAGLNIPHGAAPTTPVNGDVWTTTGGLFWRQNGSTQQAVEIGSTQTVSGNKTFSNANLTLGSSTAAGTINVGTGATISGSTKAINIGTAGVSGSTTNIIVGSSVSGAGVTVTVNGSLTTTGATQNIGNSTAASTTNIATGATISGSTKAVNIGTSGVAGSTTNITIGSTTGTSTTTLQGTTNGVTQSVGTNNTTLATTAFVIGQAGTGTPLMNGVGASGTSFSYSRNDHVHPTDTTRAPLASPTFTGTVTIPAGASISGFAPLASPALTGTPTAPTATAGTNTTQVATTAFVQQEVPAASTTAAGKVELATRLEVVEPSSSTLAVSPMRVLDVVMSPGYVQIAQNNGNVSTATVGTGASVFTTSMTRVCIGPNASVAGSAYYRPQTNGGVAQFYAKGVNNASINFSKPFWMSGRSLYDDTFRGDANNTSRITVGKSGTTIGALAQKGIGWQKVGGLATNFFLLAHNGTTLTSVDTNTSLNSLGITGGVPFDWSIYSDGSGNVTMFINDVQVATTSAGPTGYSLGSSVWQEEVDQSASAATRMYFTTFGGHYYHA